MKSSLLVPYLVLPMLSVILLIPTGCSCSCGNNGGNPGIATTQASTTAPAAHIPPITTPSKVTPTTQITSITPTAVVSTSALPTITTPPPLSSTSTATAPTANPPTTTAKPPTTSYALPPPPTAISIGSAAAPGSNPGSLTPALQWTNVPEADRYALQIFRAPFMASDMVYSPEITGLSATVPTAILAAGTQYKWAVMSHGSGGWSFISNFLFFTT